jgi:hypothetical protein
MSQNLFYIPQNILKKVSKKKLVLVMEEIEIIENAEFFFYFHHRFNLVRGSVLLSGGFSTFSITIVGNRTIILPTHHLTN